MLDVQHNCELVWNLGGYTVATRPEDAPGRCASRAAPENQGLPTIPLAESLRLAEK